MRWQHKLAISAASAALVVSACTTAIPMVRDADMALSGAMAGHLYPPADFPEDVNLDNVVFKYVAPQEVGPTCAIFGNVMDRFVAECVKTFEDGSILVVLPDPKIVSDYYYRTARKHSLGHVHQATVGKPLDHNGWRRFQ
jgi:hypothetical protein